MQHLADVLQLMARVYMVLICRDGRCYRMHSKLIRLAQPIAILVLIGLTAMAFSSLGSARGDSTSHQPHSSILINSDSGFTSNNGVVGGTGTSDDPYLISGWDIGPGNWGNEPAWNYGIMIANTTAYFSISDVTVYCNCFYGVVLSQIENGIVQNSQILVPQVGVKVDASNNFQITGDRIEGGNTVISLYNSDKFDVRNNSLGGGAFAIDGQYVSDASIVGNTGGAEDGIVLVNISGLLISQNNLRGHLSIAVQSCGDLTIDNNTANAFDDGIFVSGCSNVLVSNNIASNIPYGSGISVGESTNIGITSNTVSYDENGMIFGSNAAGNNITSNSITNNQCGVGGPETVFQDNAFYNNTFNSNNNEFCPTSGVDAPWPGFHQNPQHTGLSPFSGPSTPALRWKFQTGGSITSSPAVAYGRIYVGSSDGNLYALNLEGVLLWKFSTPSPIRTTPAVGSDGTIYVGSCLRCPYPDPSGGPEGVLYAINPDGTLKWNLTITNSGEGVDTLSSPTIGPDGTIYVSDEGFRIVAVNPDGALKWQVWTHGEVVGPPAVAPDGTIYVQIDDPPPTGSCADTLNKCLVALNPDGAIEWGLLDYGGFQSPAVGTDGTIYIDSLAVNSSGTLEWQDNQTFSSPSIGPDGTIYGTVDGGLFAVNPNGTVQWQSPLEKTGGFCTTPDCSQISRVFVQESSVAIGSDGTLYFGTGFTKYPGTSPSYGNGTVYAVNPDGTLSWTFTTGSCGPCSVNYALSDPAIGSDGTLYVGSSDGNLYGIGNP